MRAFINPPKRIPFYIKFGVWITKRVTGQELLPAKLLAWYPKAAISSGILEALVAHRDAHLDERMLKLVRLQASFAVACPFCIDMNSVEDARAKITREELAALPAFQISVICNLPLEHLKRDNLGPSAASCTR